MSLTLTSSLIIGRLEWDVATTVHIQAHGLSIEDVEHACQHILFIGDSYATRLAAIRELSDGRLVTIILADKGNDSYYPVSARSTSRKERREVDQQGGDQNTNNYDKNQDAQN